MRTTKDIKEHYRLAEEHEQKDIVEKIFLEVLLDMRELLAAPGVQQDFSKRKDEISD
jgi:hypothetical protein